MRRLRHLPFSGGGQGHFSICKSDVMCTMFRSTACDHRLVKAGERIEKCLDVVNDRIAKQRKKGRRMRRCCWDLWRVKWKMRSERRRWVMGRRHGSSRLRCMLLVCDSCQESSYVRFIFMMAYKYDLIFKKTM